MAELLDRIHAEIRERLETSRAAAQEYERLEAALAALGGPVGASAPRPASAVPAPRAAKRAARNARRASGGPRARRGANRAAVLGVLGERPGVGVSELSAAAGVARPALYALLARLTEQGEIVKELLPAGSTGYSLPREPSAFPSPLAAQHSPEPASVDDQAVTDQAEDDSPETHESSGPEAAAA